MTIQPTSEWLAHARLNSDTFQGLLAVRTPICACLSQDCFSQLTTEKAAHDWMKLKLTSVLHSSSSVAHN